MPGPDALAAVVRAAFAARQASTPSGLPTGAGSDRIAPIAGEEIDPFLLGELHEKLAAPDARRRSGRHYTPEWLARGIVVLAGIDDQTRAVVDPSAGGGVFLLAALDALVAAGVGADEAMARVGGLDLDPAAVAVANAAIGLWGLDRGVEDRPEPNVVEADALVDTWPPPVGGDTTDVVVGNPPFLTPLRSATGRSSTDTHRIADSLGLRPGPYTDTAALFLDRAMSEVATGGRVALVLPASVASARDASEIRRRADARGRIRAVWRDDGSAFDASVNTFVPVIERINSTSGPAAVDLYDGTGFEQPTGTRRRDPGTGPAWTLLLDGDAGPATPTIRTGPGTLAELARVTAGFRDEFYAIARATEEAADHDDADAPRIVTSGLIDVGGHAWGVRPATIAGRRWRRPVLDLAALDRASPRIAAWCRDRLVAAKIVVATQTRLIEPAPDPDGRLVPLTPVLSVEPADGAAHLVTAVLLAPPVSRWLVDRRLGSGRSPRAIRISARDVASLPLPADEGAWHEAAAFLGDAAGSGPLTASTLCETGRLMTRAYRARAETFEWWRQRWHPEG